MANFIEEIFYLIIVLLGDGTESDPIVIDLTSDSDDEDEQHTISSSAVSVITNNIPSSSSTSSSTPSSTSYIVTIPTQNNLAFEPRGEICTDFGRSIKRRCSSPTDDHDACEPPLKVPATASVSSTAQPMPVIKEYAPTLPCFNPPTCTIPLLSQPFAMQTVLASSDTNTLQSGFNIPYLSSEF